jgi:hypothetical protein
MSAYATQLSELDHHNLLQEALRQRDRAEAAERRADALEQALRIALDALTDDRIGTTRMDDPDLYRTLGDAVSAVRAALTDQPTTPRDRLAGILSDMGASPERAGEVLAEIERRVADQPADAGGASCCARTRADERERCAAAIRTNRRVVSGHRETWINAGLEEAEHAIRRTNGDTP